MSAFMVQDKTINTIVSFRVDSRFGKDHKGWMQYNTDLDVSRPEKLGQRLFDMNVKAIEARYGEGQAKDFRDLDYKFVREFHYTPVSVLKAMGCLSYQCCEGDVDESPLFKDLDKIKGTLAEWIVSRTAEYEAAPWD